jgi:lysophospholipase L1-like esterase
MWAMGVAYGFHARRAAAILRLEGEQVYGCTTSRWASLILVLALASCGSQSPSPPTGVNPAPTPGAGTTVVDAGGGVEGDATSGTPPVSIDNTDSSSGMAEVDGSPIARNGPDASAQPDASSSIGDGGTEGLVDARGDGDVGAAAPVDAGPPAVRFVARVDRTNPMSPRFAWSGSTMLARFTGSSIGVHLSGPTTYFDVSIDGVMQAAPLMISTASQNYPLATNLAAGPHELTVYRRNEPGIGGTGDTTFLGLILDPAGALLPPSIPSARRIEIVGDSITSGFGDESMNSSCPNQLSAQDYDVAYGAVAARTVSADLITIAWTGKGMYRNSGGDTTNTMPILYGRTLPDQTTDTWDFTSWIPDAVVIYLGNNDFGQGDPGQAYVTTYKTFIARVRKNYPNALIVCTIGPNLTDPKLSEERTYVQGIVAASNTAGDKNVDFLEMPQPLSSEGTGCGGHPLASTHKRMGAALAAELQMKLAW